MIRRFCDCCGDEITKANIVDNHLNRLGAEIKGTDGTGLKVEVHTAKDLTWNSGDFCKYCILDAIKQADDRTEKAPETAANLDIYHQVVQFNLAFGAITSLTPMLPESSLPEDFKAELTMVLPMLEMLQDYDTGGSTRGIRVRLMLEEFAEYLRAEVDDDLVEVADALTDLTYISAGTCDVYGLPGRELFEEVHNNNMSKLGPGGKVIRREDGKILKPDNWTPPDIAGVIKRFS